MRNCDLGSKLPAPHALLLLRNARRALQPVGNVLIHTEGGGEGGTNLRTPVNIFIDFLK